MREQESQYVDMTNIDVKRTLFNICHEALTDKESLVFNKKQHSLKKKVRSEYEIDINLNVRKSASAQMGKKSHKCDDYGKDFPRNSNLIELLRIHSGEKPFKCDQCDKMFT